MIMDEPKVSIVIPVYNGGDYLGEAIDSALSQTYPHIEIIVVNDGSTDEGATERVALSYGSRIRYIHKENGGVATALNTGIQLMSGQYFSWLSHDDKYMPEKIANQLEALRQFAEEAVVYCDYDHINAEGNYLRSYSVSPKGLTNMRSLLAISQEPGINGCTLLIPRSFFDRFGLFDPALRYTQDVDVWFRMAGNVPFIHVKQVLVQSRQHEGQDTQKNKLPVHEENDRTLSRLISNLSHQEVAQYCGYSAEKALEYCSVYAYWGFEKIAFRLLKHGCMMANTPDGLKKAANILAATIRFVGGVRGARRLWEGSLRDHVLARKQKPRIVVFFDAWVRGGSQRVMAAVIHALKDKYDWFLVSANKSNGEGFPLDECVVHLKLDGESRNGLSSRLAALSALLDADLFIGVPNYLVESLDVYKKLNGMGIRSIACNFGHYFLPYMYKSLYAVIERRTEAFEHASAVTWLTSFSANIYAQLQDNGVTLPTPNTFAGTSELAPKRDKVILAVGRFNDPVKRLDRMLEVFSKVLKNHPDATLLLVGKCRMAMRPKNDSGETVREMIRRLGIPWQQVQLVGEQAHVQPYYMQASVFMLTSESEGIPMVLNEAGTFGLPCVINQIAGLEEIVLEGENGFTVPQGDMDAMADKISLLLSDFDLRVRMGNRASELVNRYNREYICRRWNQLIDLILASSDKRVLNAELSSQFMEPVRDASTFHKLVEIEYNRNFAKLLNAKLEASAFKETASTLIKPLRWGASLYVRLRSNGPRAIGRKAVAKIRTRLKG